ncbi:tRNA-dihydrouridine synthase family protein [Phanerochaete sordida]|uniref:tRNA-dihydrouridine synthase family protein n=1 Tax=Phanerochaete sordida TaxID=48140 RepID=A0A9P3LBQ2_9APHY|nr:tRNA-dihydrouridine synthase family protein [Phanerochaete sordida]
MTPGNLARRSPSPAASDARAAKRRKLEYPPLTPDDYRNGVMLAPMVRSGALPTRLFALKHGAKLVWGPEIVDKAILHATRVEDPVTGVVSYMGVSKAIWTTHPIEKPFLIYQIGSADPALAVQAAQKVMHDVAGVDLNCGCPKPFSTHAGMGAALLTNPDLLISILTALRAALPPHIAVSAKIRLLPTQEDTLRLVERIVGAGVSCLTVHCRTRSMRPRDRARVERLEEIVRFVRSLGRDVAVIENGDCEGYEDAKRIRKLTGADSCMIATAAEANPTVFSPRPLVDLETTFIPQYVRLGKYLDNHFSSTKFCASQFRGEHAQGTRTTQTAMKNAITHAKRYEDLDALVGPWTGAHEFAQIVQAIEARAGDRQPKVDDDAPTDPAPAPSTAVEAAAAADALAKAAEQENSPAASDGESATLSTASSQPAELKTPVQSHSPDPALLRAPLVPANESRLPVPAMVAGEDVPTPTPTQQMAEAA